MFLVREDKTRFVFKDSISYNDIERTNVSGRSLNICKLCFFSLFRDHSMVMALFLCVYVHYLHRESLEVHSVL